MDNLAQYNKEMVNEISEKTPDELKARLIEIQSKMKDYLDIGLSVPHKLRAESILILNHLDNTTTLSNN